MDLKSSTKDKMENEKYVLFCDGRLIEKGVDPNPTIFSRIRKIANVEIGAIILWYFPFYCGVVGHFAAADSMKYYKKAMAFPDIYELQLATSLTAWLSENYWFIFVYFLILTITSSLAQRKFFNRSKIKFVLWLMVSLPTLYYAKICYFLFLPF